MRSAFSTWLYKIAVNECWDSLRKKKVRPLVYESDLSEEQVQRLDSYATVGRSPAGPDEQAQARELVELLLTSLSEEDKRILLLKEVEGLSVQEIAEILIERKYSQGPDVSRPGGHDGCLPPPLWRASTQAGIPPLEAAEKQAMYRLAVLLGERPGAVDAELAPAEIRPYARALPVGDTTELLRRRPDVRAAERRLAAASARVGVATADLFPRVTVTGFVGFLSGNVGHLFSTAGGDDARAWSVAPSVSWPAFDLGSVRARLRGREAELDAASAAYAQAVLVALEDTENSFLGYAKQQAALKSLAEQARASAHATELADLQYRAGVADFLTLLDAQRTQLEAEDAAAQAQTAVNLGVVAIYKALGGVGQPPEAAAGRVVAAAR